MRKATFEQKKNKLIKMMFSVQSRIDNYGADNDISSLQPAIDEMNLCNALSEELGKSAVFPDDIIEYYERVERRIQYYFRTGHYPNTDVEVDSSVALGANLQ